MEIWKVPKISFEIGFIPSLKEVRRIAHEIEWYSAKIFYATLAKSYQPLKAASLKLLI